MRGDRAEEVLLVAQRREVREAVAAVCEHHAEVAHDLAGIVLGAALARLPELLREGVGQPELVGHRGEQRAARVRTEPLAVRRDLYLLEAAFALHLQGDPPEREFVGSTTTFSLLRRTFPASAARGANR